jgi:Fe-S oxidoreductase
MAKMKSEFLYHYQKKHGTSLRNRLFGHIGCVNQLGSFLAPLSNRFIQSSLSKYLLEKIGITSRRTLPYFSSERFSKWISKQKQQTAFSNEVAAIPAKKNNEPPNGAKAYSPGEGSPVRGDAPLGKELAGIAEVVLFCDTYTEFNTPSIGKAAFALLQQLGYKIHTPGWVCCGRPLFSKGLLKEARRQANKTIHLLRPFVEREIPIIVLEPSCLSIFTDDYKDLISHPGLLGLTALCISLDEFLQRHLLDPRFLSLFSPNEKTIAFHNHCHQKSLIGSAHTLRVLQALPGAQIIEIPSGCCGMAGSFGYEKEHYDFSLKIGEDRLFPAIRSLSPQAQLLASGTSCRSQISHGTGAHARHLAEVLFYNSTLTS